MGVTLIREDEAPRYTVHGAKIVGYASPSRGSGSLATWKVTLDAGAQSPLPSLDVDEVFICLRGAAEFRFGGESRSMAAGDCLTVTGGTPFQFMVVGSEPFEAVACVRAGCRATVEGGAPFAPRWAV